MTIEVGLPVPYPEPEGPWFFTLARGGKTGGGMSSHLEYLLSTLHYELAFHPDTVITVSRQRREPHIWTPEFDLPARVPAADVSAVRPGRQAAPRAPG